MTLKQRFTCSALGIGIGMIMICLAILILDIGRFIP